MASGIDDFLEEQLSEVQIELQRVKPGSRYAYDLFDEYGNLILEAHTELDEPLIKHLVSSGIEYLYYNPQYRREEENVAGLDLAKRLVDEELMREMADDSRDLLDFVRDIFDYSPENRITKARIEKSRTLVDRVIGQIDQGRDGVFIPLTRLKDISDYEYAHSTNASILGALLGSRLELKREERMAMGLGGLFHDIGKSSVAKELLNKNGKLSDEEFDIIKEHPHVGYKLVETNPHMHELEKQIVLLHHERSDGAGYPYGLDSDHYMNRVPKEVRLFSICDAYSALVLKRAYGRQYSSKKAFRILLNMVYAPYKKRHNYLPADFRDFTRAMLFVLNRGSHFLDRGDLVRLNTGEVGIVEDLNRLYPLNPRIRMLTNRELQPLKRQIEIDMLKDYTSYIANVFDRSTTGANQKGTQ